MTVQPGGPQPDGRRLSGGVIASLGGVAVLLIFIIQNREKVRFHFLFWSFAWPLWWYTILTAVFGALVVRVGRDASSPASRGTPLVTSQRREAAATRRP